MAVAAQSYALVSLAELKTILNISSLEGVDDELQTMINYISKQAAVDIAKRVLVKTDLTEVYDGHGKEELLLNNWPILDSTDDAEISDPVMTLDSDGDDDWETAASHGLELKWTLTKEPGILYLKYRNNFPRGKRNIKIVYTAGYLSTAVVPEDLKLAAAEAIALMKKKFDHNLHGLQSVSALGENTTFRLDEWPKSALLVFKNYGRVLI